MKSDGVYILNLKRTWEKLLLAARAIVAIENPADASVIFSGNTGQRAVLSLLLHWSHSDCCRFTPGTLTNQIQAPSRSPGCLWSLTPGRTTSLSWRHPKLLYLSLLCVTQILLCTMWTSPSHVTTRELTQRV
ncbi:40S ribosomal protein SA [Plecturocebus cupreus]